VKKKLFKDHLHLFLGWIIVKLLSEKVIIMKDPKINLKIHPWSNFSPHITIDWSLTRRVGIAHLINHLLITVN
jgi:hypothetical protein